MIQGVRRFAALDALRGLCACLVCLFHFRVVSPLNDVELVRQSWLFVDFFFVLSGFVIAANYRERLANEFPLARFMLLRLGRIYPLHVFMLAVFVATELAALAIASAPGGRALFDAGHAPEAIVTNLLLIQSFGIEGRLTWNHPAWSIATEIWAYLLFAVAVRVSGRHLDVVLIAVVVAAPLLLLVIAGGINVSWDHGLLRCVYGFALGVLCWTIWQRAGERWLARAEGWTTIEAAAAAATIGFVVVAGATSWNLLAPPLFAVAVLVFARQGGGLSRLLATPVPLFLGMLSYSIYMVHTYVQSRFDDVLALVGGLIDVPLTSTIIAADGRVTRLVGADPTQGLLLTLLMLALVVATSWLTYRLIEVPGQRWSRRAAERRLHHVRGRAG